MLNRKIIVTFLTGLIIGFALPFVVRPFLGDRLPQAVGGRRQSVEGLVTAKQREADRLLITIVAPEGATLVTFTERVPEIDLLVDAGDRVTLTMSRYEPFLEDPNITRVAKPDAAALAEPAATPDTIPALPDTLAERDSVPADSAASPWY
jgi:hypothetical protein